MELAGVEATVETPQGRVEGVFPDLISPHQPFIDMQSITYATASGEIVIRFEGDLWEMRISATGPTPPTRPIRHRCGCRTRSRSMKETGSGSE